MGPFEHMLEAALVSRGKDQWVFRLSRKELEQVGLPPDISDGSRVTLMDPKTGKQRSVPIELKEDQWTWREWKRRLLRKIGPDTTRRVKFRWFKPNGVNTSRREFTVVFTVPPTKAAIQALRNVLGREAGEIKGQKGLYWLFDTGRPEMKIQLALQALHRAGFIWADREDVWPGMDMEDIISVFAVDLKHPDNPYGGRFTESLFGADGYPEKLIPGTKVRVLGPVAGPMGNPKLTQGQAPDGAVIKIERSNGYVLSGTDEAGRIAVVDARNKNVEVLD